MLKCNSQLYFHSAYLQSTFPKLHISQCTFSPMAATQWHLFCVQEIKLYRQWEGRSAVFHSAIASKYTKDESTCVLFSGTATCLCLLIHTTLGAQIRICEGSPLSLYSVFSGVYGCHSVHNSSTAHKNILTMSSEKSDPMRVQPKEHGAIPFWAAVQGRGLTQ